MDSKPLELERLEAAHAAAPGSRHFAPLADAYRRAGRLEEALRLLEQGTAAHPDYVSALVLLGQSYMERRDPAAAAAAFERVLAQDPENLVALKHRAQQELRRQSWDQAENLLALVLEIDPYDHEALQARQLLSAQRAAAPGSPAAPAAARAQAGAPAWPPPPVVRAEPQAPRVPMPNTAVPPGRDRSAPPQEAPADWQVQRDEERIVVRPRGATQYRPVLPAGASDEFSTLTVARIYESQGYVDKALAIYEALQRRRPDDAEVRERIAALRARAHQAAAPQTSDAAAAPRWRLLDPLALAAAPQQTAAELRDLAGAVRESQREQRHTVVGTPPRPPQTAPPPADEPDYERFLRYVRSLKRGG